MKNSQKKTKKQKNHLPHFQGRQWSWAAYLMSNGAQTLIMAQMMFYLTDSVMMSAAIVSAIIAVSRVFDGISDVIAGLIIDRTKTRWGKARPYSLFTILMWGAVIAVFSVPNIPTWGKIIYVFVLYNLSDTVARTMLFASESVHMKRAFNSDEQIDIVGVTGLIAGVFNMIISIIMPQLIKGLGATKEGWTIIALMIGLPCMVLGLLKFFFLPELDVEEVTEEKKKQKISLKESVVALFHNKYIFVFEIALLTRMILQGLSVSTYYFKYIVGDIGKLSIISMLGLLSMVLMPFIPVLTRKMGIKNFCSFFLILGGVCYIPAWLAPTNMAALGLASAASLLASLPISMLMNLVAIQCMKYSEWKDGIQIEGLVSSMNGVSQKVGLALGTLLCGVMLSVGGYDGSLAVQPDSAVTTLKMAYILIPMVLLIIAGLCMQMYTLEKKLPQIESELTERSRQSV